MRPGLKTRPPLRLFALVLAVAVLAADSPSSAQVAVSTGAPVTSAADAATGTAVVSGIVVDATTNAPIPGAVVYLGLDGRGRPAQQSRQLTDSRGRFVFVEVPASDRLTVSVSKAGYLPGGFDREDAAGSTSGRLTVADGAWVQDVRVELAKLGAIGGAVFDERGDPVVGVFVRALARLRIAGRERLAGGPMATTDDRGRYRIPNLAPGRYVIFVPSVQPSVPAAATSAEIAGYTDARLAQSRARGFTPDIPAEQAVDRGTGLRVVVGPYPVPPPPAGGIALAYPPTFHPGTASASEAAPVALGLGESRENVDVRLTPMRVARITGRVEGPPTAVSGLTLRLLAAGMEELGPGSETATALVAPDGTFGFANVPAGTYTIEAPLTISEYQYSQSSPFGPAFVRPPGTLGYGASSGPAGVGPPGTTAIRITMGGAATRMYGHATVSVADADATDVVLRLVAPGRISGHVGLDADPDQPGAEGPSWVSMRAEPLDGSLRLGVHQGLTDRSDPDRPFSIETLPPGRYMLRANVSPPWSIKSISQGGRDYTYRPFDTTATPAIDDVTVTVTNATATLSGAVRTSQTGPAVSARVIVFPVEREQWTQFGTNPPRVRSVVTTNLGTYRFESLPAGAYLLVAIPDARFADWRDPAFFERAAGQATQVTVGWGETQSRDLEARTVVIR
jgi:hypothetical protein